MLELRSLIVIIAILLVGCTASNRSTSDEVQHSSMDRNPEHLAKMELIDFLRAKPGVEIKRFGNSYRVLIRGNKSFQGDDDPIYVLDGVVIGKQYAQVANAVDVTQVDKVTVLPASRAGIYGSRGQNGVIIIETRKM